MKQIESEKPKIFISYSRVDEEKIHKIYRQLKEWGFDPWVDMMDLLGGTKWKPIISGMIKKSDFFLACLSKNSVSKKGYFQAELKDGLATLKEYPTKRIYLIPIRLDDCQVPDELSDYNWIDIFKSNGLDKLFKTIEMEWTARKKLRIDQRNKKDSYYEILDNVTRIFEAPAFSSHVDLMFSGKYDFSLGKSGLITIPSRFRNILIEYNITSLFIIKSLSSNHLTLHAKHHILKILENISQLIDEDKNVSELLRLLLFDAYEVQMNSSGNIRIPKNLLQIAKIRKSISLLGVGDRIEIWSKDELDNYMQEVQSNF